MPKICQKYENLEKKYHFEPRKLSLIIQSIQSIFIYMIYYHLDQLYSSFQHGLSLITSVISSIFMAQNVKKGSTTWVRGQSFVETGLY